MMNTNIIALYCLFLEFTKVKGKIEKIDLSSFGALKVQASVAELSTRIIFNYSIEPKVSDIQGMLLEYRTTGVRNGKTVHKPIN